MPNASRPAVPRPKPRKKTAGKAGAALPKPAHAKRRERTATNVAIATELAPAVAIALLEKTEQSPGDPAPALDCLAAAATPSETAGKLRLQLVFENGAVLPVEMSTAAGAALSRGLLEELPKK